MLLERFDLPTITHKIGTVGGPPNGPSHLPSCRRDQNEATGLRGCDQGARGTERLMTARIYAARCVVSQAHNHSLGLCCGSCRERLRPILSQDLKDSRDCCGSGGISGPQLAAGDQK
jgi:hypothetical protein